MLRVITTGASTRRQFLHASFIGSVGAATARFLENSEAALVKPKHDPSDGLKLGLASYTFRKFPLDRALEMTRQAGLKYISLKDMHLPLKSTQAECQEAHRKVEEANLTLMGGGVIYLSNKEPEVRAAFQYAHDAGMPTIICSPDPDALDLVEKTAKEFQIRVAIHNHGPGDNRYPSPLDVLRLVKDRDLLMGLCMDVGHTVRIGVDPIPVIHECAARLYDFHIKDETQAAPTGQPIAVGRGVIDIVGVLRALLAIHYSYQVALEYEAHPDDPLPGVIESVAYMRGILATLAVS